MKHFKRLLLFLFSGIVLLCSCKKDSQASVNTGTGTGPAGPAFGNSLTGKEFILSSSWSFWTDGMGDEIYVAIDPSTSFSIQAMANQGEEVSIKLDSSSSWITVPGYDWYSSGVPANTSYNWYFPTYPYANSKNFIIENYPLNYQLIGKTVQVKVKF